MSEMLSPESVDTELRRSWEQAVADEDYELAKHYQNLRLWQQLGQTATADWSEPALFSHGRTFGEIQAKHDALMQEWQDAETAKIPKAIELGERIGELLAYYPIAVLYPEIDRN